MTDVTVAIVGAGPVAMTAALLLARHGIDSVMFERSESRDPIGSKALCMQRDVLDVLERVGVGDDLVSEGVTWTLGRTYYRNHELFQLTFPDLGEAHFPPFVNVGQDRTEARLEARVGESDHTSISYASEVVGLSQSDDSVRLETSDGTISAEYVIGADGSRSSTRELLGIPFPGRSFDDLFLICDIRAELPFSNERRFFFDPEWNPGRQVLIHPQAGSVWRIDWQVPPDFDVEWEESTGELDRRIREVVGDADYEIIWKTVYRFHERVAASFHEGRVFLAGDAAHLFAPFGARGLNSGIQDVENLAWKLAYVLGGWAPESLLDTYETERRAAALENLAVTSKTMEFLVPQDAEQRRHRMSVLEAAVTDPDARSEVNAGTLAEPYWYTDSPLTTGGRSGNAKPSRVVPGVLCPDLPVEGGDVTRLRRLFGLHPVVLTTDDASEISEALVGRRPPIEVHDLSRLDPRGVLRRAVGRPRFAIVVRPDGHVASVSEPAPASVATAVDRSIGHG